MILVTSWDDGHPLDERLADMLARHDIGGTFYVPLRNRETRPVMTGRQIRSLREAGFEIGGHTLDHVYLTSVSPAEARAQIRGCRSALEDVLGEAVDGFCYPGGKWTPALADVVREAGFTYARTCENLRVDVGEDPFALPVTLQFYPHPAHVLWANALRKGSLSTRIPMLLRGLSAGEWSDRASAIARAACEAPDAVLHLWGHSWEIEAHGLWRSLEATLVTLRSLARDSMTVETAVARRMEMAS